MTAEPRMEDLLASIRKAIQDDIGEVPVSSSGQSAGTLHRGAMRELHMRVGEEAGSAAAEIQQLRERIQRTRTSDLSTREAPVRPSRPNAVADLAVELPRRSWRELEPVPQLRPTVMEPEYSPPPERAEIQRRRSEPQTPQVAPVHVASRAWHEEAQQPLPPQRDRQPGDEPAMLSGSAAEAVQSAFTRLAQNMFSQAGGERSIEDLTRELLRPMLKQWLDDNLPSLVERLVREEIERVARHGR